MTWLAILLIGWAVTDLTHSVRPVRILPECVGAATAVLVGLAAGLTDSASVVALVAIAALTVAWGQSVTYGFGRDRPGWPLLVFGGGLALAIAVAGEAPDLVGDPMLWWWEGNPLLARIPPTQGLLLVGILLAQLSTGNVVTRLVLAATDTVNPLKHGQPEDPELRLKGGRLLGPMERILIVGLGFFGNLTAASIVIAAKGLLRFPELNSDEGQQRVHKLTEYFLVGSFTSWLFALAGVAVLRLS